MLRGSCTIKMCAHVQKKNAIADEFTAFIAGIHIELDQYSCEAIGHSSTTISLVNTWNDDRKALLHVNNTEIHMKG